MPAFVEEGAVDQHATNDRSDMAAILAEFAAEVYGGVTGQRPPGTVNGGDGSEPQQIDAFQFDLYGLTLERGLNSGERDLYNCYRSARGEVAGAVLIDPRT